MRNANFKPTTKRRRGQTMIALMVSVLILIGLMMAFLGSRRGDDGELRPSVAKQSIDRSQEIALQSNISQIHQFIGMYKSDNDGKPPASLEELKRVAKYPAELFINPVDKQPLDYDPVAGRMIVKPYEGMSPMIQKMNAGPVQGADQMAPPAAPPINNTFSAPDSNVGPGGVKMPPVNNTFSAPADDSQ